MLSRALSLATVMLLIGCFAAAPAHAQAQNLEAGKSPSQIFAGTCTACHKSPRGLLRTVPAGSLPGFLRQHYTTSSEMASLLSTYLISNGATDTRYGGASPSRTRMRDRRQGPKASRNRLDRHGRRMQRRRARQQSRRRAARPDADRRPRKPSRERRGRNARRLARAGQGPDAAKPAEAQAGRRRTSTAAMDARPAGRTGRRGRPAIDEEPGKGAATPRAKTDAKDDAKTDERQGRRSPTAGQDRGGQGPVGKDRAGKRKRKAAMQDEPAAAKPPSEGSTRQGRTAEGHRQRR